MEVKVRRTAYTFQPHLIDAADTGIWIEQNLRKKLTCAQMKVDGTALGVAPSTHARFYLNAQTILRKCNDICGKKCTMLSFFFHGSQQMHIVRTDAYGTDTYVVLVAQLRHLLCIRSGGTCA